MMTVEKPATWFLENVPITFDHVLESVGVALNFKDSSPTIEFVTDVQDAKHLFCAVASTFKVETLARIGAQVGLGKSQVSKIRDRVPDIDHRLNEQYRVAVAAMNALVT